MSSQTEEFLVKSCNLLENSTNEHHRVIYQQLRQKHLELKNSSSTALPEATERRNKQDVHNKKVACRWCCSSWASGQYSLRLAPQKRPQRYKQLLRKCSGDFSQLPEHRLKFAGSNFMLLKCFTCWQTTKIPLTKPMVESSLKNDSKDNDESSSQAKKKKRKRKKDDLAGLNPDAVKRCKLSASASPTTSSSSTTTNGNQFTASTSSFYGMTTETGRASSPQRPPGVIKQPPDDKPPREKSSQLQQNKRTMKEVNDKTSTTHSSTCSTANKKRLAPPKSTSDILSQALPQNQKKRKKKSNKLKGSNTKKTSTSAKSSVAEFISSI